MAIEPKEVFSDKDKSLVAELFKLLDNWDKENSRRKPSKKIAGQATGFSASRGSVNQGG